MDALWTVCLGFGVPVCPALRVPVSRCVSSFLEERRHLRLCLWRRSGFRPDHEPGKEMIPFFRRAPSLLHPPSVHR